MPRLANARTVYRSRMSFADLQDYSSIREKCLSEGVLFEDPEFPAEVASLCYTKPPDRDVIWRRPGEFCANPQWMNDDFSRFDVVQGYLGTYCSVRCDCWLLAAVASLTCNKRLLARVVPPEQSFQHGYCGIFHFRLWYQGQWVDVVVDDRLPTFDTHNPQLLYMHSASKTEFWSALLEKAYAKVYRCYESLQGGSAIEAMEDLTGGLGETILVGNTPPDYLVEVMEKTLERGGVMTCSMNIKEPDFSVNVRRSIEGLLGNHTYSITGLKLLPLMDGSKTRLIRIRNPWGDGQEWRGRWADGAAEWNLIPQDTRRQLSVRDDEDGEFWMCMDDFRAHFSKIDLCNLDPLHLGDAGVTTDKQWDVASYHKSWIKYVNAGGCLNYVDSMWRNPQFHVQLMEADDTSGTCTMIVALMQKDTRRLFKDGHEYLGIGYVIYKLPESNEGRPLTREFFTQNRPLGKSKAFSQTREVCGRHQLPPGDYVIIPSTFHPDQAAHFLLRIFTEKRKSFNEMDDVTSFEEIDSPDCVDGIMDDLDHLMIDVGEEEIIDAYRLKEILGLLFTTEFTFSGFSLDACRSMIAMLDHQMTGSLDFKGYKDLCRHLLDWKACFEASGADKEGNLSSYYLRPFLNLLGYRISNDTLQALVLRYVNRDGNMDFGDFIMCIVRLTNLIEKFESPDVKSSDTKTLDKLLRAALYS
ncbi:calpain-A-like isoform X1 [Haliotis rufescens]|uniref:calpain-A-like isoform X1 n=1 Tax=Haliotis rufescens TaxID=6454 RepID=UPI00201F8899|nr:calpain-A-like isoform X1 [Haliotis rufescens]